MPSISGPPSGTGQQAGDFQATSDGANPPNLTAPSTPPGGSAQAGTAGTISFPAGTNNTIIPGVTLTAAAAPSGAMTVFHVTVTTEGIGQSLSDYLQAMLGVRGLFKAQSVSTRTEYTTNK